MEHKKVFIFHIVGNREGSYDSYSKIVSLKELERSWKDDNEATEFFMDEEEHQMIMQDLQSGRSSSGMDDIGQGVVGFGFTKEDAEKEARELLKSGEGCSCGKD